MSRHLVIVASTAYLLFNACAAAAQTSNSNVKPESLIAAHLSSLTKELRWSDDESRKRYDSKVDDITREALSDIDSFVAEYVKADDSAERATRKLESVLRGLEGPGSITPMAFTSDLLSGHYLIVGFDLLRVTGATTNDVISFRAYKATGGTFGFIAAAGEDFSGRELRSLTNLSGSDPSEFGFIALGSWPAIGTPYSLQARAYFFDGRSFRTVWASNEFRTSDISSAIRETSGGFAIKFLSDDMTHLIQDAYLVTSTGAQRTAHVELSR